MSTIELKCIELSREAKLSSARKLLSDLKSEKLSFENPLGDLSGGVEWSESLSERVKQVLLLPIAFLLMFFVYATVPIVYLLDLWNLVQKKRDIKFKIKELETGNLPNQFPTKKILEELWLIHGMSSRKYSSDEALGLLERWLDTLYGDEVSKLQLSVRIKEICNRQMKTNLPYYEGKPNAAHFHFIAPIEVLIQELSLELPEYQ